MPQSSSENIIEEEIEKEKKEFDFDIREYTLEFLKQQFNPAPILGREAEMYIPDYQRELFGLKNNNLYL